MEEFILNIEKDVELSLDDLQRNYLSQLNDLYPNIHSYNDPDILEHYRLLSIKQPHPGPTDIGTVHSFWKKAYPFGRTQFCGDEDNDFDDYRKITFPLLSFISHVGTKR